ncbi:MAG: hypothetical protein K2H46_00335 [Muribaculaceae bacterium]|nr:hypothetical protein [Muribaculaceae bacterium]
MKKLRNLAVAVTLVISMFVSAAYAQPEEENQTENTIQVLEDISGGNVNESNGEDVVDSQKSSEHAKMYSKDKAIDGKEGKEKNSINWVSVIALLLGIGGVAIGALNLLSIKNLQSYFNKTKDKNKKNFKNIEERLEAMKQSLELSRQKIERCENDILKLKTELSANRAASQSVYVQQSPHATDYSTEHPRTPYGSVGARQTGSDPVSLYSGVPRGGVFSNISRNQTTQSLYVITDNGGNSGTYSFIDGRSSAMVAARSTSDFLDPGCIISGNQNQNFTRVRTITPGVVHKTANGWVIDSKAVVELV